MRDDAAASGRRDTALGKMDDHELRDAFLKDGLGRRTRGLGRSPAAGSEVEAGQRGRFVVIDDQAIQVLQARTDQRANVLRRRRDHLEIGLQPGLPRTP